VSDLSLRVMAGAGWAFLILNLGPELVTILGGMGLLPTVPGLSAPATERVYVVGLALLGPLVLWLTSGRRRGSYSWNEMTWR